MGEEGKCDARNQEVKVKKHLSNEEKRKHFRVE
jgi:hypothetical protein